MPPAAPDRADDALDRERLAAVAADLGVGLGADQLATFARYAALLVEANRQVNLTRLTRPEEIAVQLLADSLVCLQGLPDDRAGPDEALRCVDVGTGAGLPGLALAVVRPRWRVTLVDATAKKVAFVDRAIAALKLPNARAIHARAEDLAGNRAHRHGYDLAVARAVAPLPKLLGYLLPLVRPGGRALALKGAEVAAEIEAAAPVLERFGARVLESRPYRLPGLDQPRHLVVVAPSPAPHQR
jgi:16S rRNA (guanine527-N7)-methyltransferase